MAKTQLFSTVVFDKLPEHDTCWAFIEGTDGKLYTGVCGEITGWIILSKSASIFIWSPFIYVKDRGMINRIQRRSDT